jgi:hypothetical protein
MALLFLSLKDAVSCYIRRILIFRGTEPVSEWSPPAMQYKESNPNS